MKKLSPEEAEKVLEDMKVKIEIPKAAVTQWKRNTALDMAIEALKYSEVPNSSDCISRQAAIDALEKVAALFPWRVPGNRDSYDRYNEAWNDAIGRAEIEIEELSSVQPEIIHCRDCKHWREGNAYSYCQKLFNCGVLDVYDYMRAEDDFCSLAERREE